MYVLMLHATPIAIANRFERLSEAMSEFSAAMQDHMVIVPNVEVLK